MNKINIFENVLCLALQLFVESIQNIERHHVLNMFQITVHLILYWLINSTTQQTPLSLIY